MIDAWNSLSTPLKLRLLLVVLALLGPWWLGPLRIKEKQKRPGMPAGMELVPGIAAVPAALASFVAETQRTLTALGFGRFGILKQQQGIVLLGIDDTGTVAAGLALPKANGTIHSLVGFTTQLAGGTKIRTSNSPLPSIVPAPSGEDRLRVHTERDAARLHALHKARVAQAVAAGKRVVALDIGDPVAYQRREEQSSIAQAVACGYWTRRGEQLVLTWKGAFLSAWRMLPPWRQLSERRDSQVASRLVRA
ncbi:MAG TPA: hypothetical protein VF761_16155 [Gemmatimonadaceae bacterium]